MADSGFSWTGALSWTWSNRSAIIGYLAQVRDWFRSDPGRGILMIGPGGTGKTTLAALLSGKFDWLLSEPWRYDESFGIEEFTLKDDPKSKIVVPPGQTARRDMMWAEVEKNLANGLYRGVIFVNAFGYHSMARDSYKLHSLYRGNKESFLEAYFEACRQDELTVLKRVAGTVRSTPGKLWVLSVVAKEDLWSPERQGATAFYETGEYASVVEQLAAIRDQHTFRHEILPASLLIGNFLSGAGESLAKNAAGYDHHQQIASLRRLFEIVNALREWEIAT